MWISLKNIHEEGNANIYFIPEEKKVAVLVQYTGKKNCESSISYCN
jgi:hypothetical protein